MPRFAPYRFREQVGDQLIFVDLAGQERRVPFQILDVSPPKMAVGPLFAAHLMAGAWVRQDLSQMFALQRFVPLPMPTADNELDALTRFLHVLRRSGTLYDQVNQPFPGELIER
jgi:hypothetical protein